MSSLLIASHIKPWSKSLEDEKIDPNNGLLLCSMHDALFDRGYITFDEMGNIIISNEINRRNYEKLNIENSSYIYLNSSTQKKYMNYHREYIFKK